MADYWDEPQTPAPERSTADALALGVLLSSPFWVIGALLCVVVWFAS